MERNKRLKALQDKQREAEEESLKKLFKPKINPKSAQVSVALQMHVNISTVS